jgi:transcriptional regulator with XRE-family HTH domain
MTVPVKDVFRRRVKQVRVKLHRDDGDPWTQADLAARLEELGLVPMDRVTVAKIETQNRNVSLEEFLGFAAALEVEPVALLLDYDAPDDELIEIAPGVHATAERIRDWFHGKLPLGTDELPTKARLFWDEVPEPEKRAMRTVPAISRLRAYLTGVERAAANGDRVRVRNGLVAIAREIKNEIDAMDEEN